MKNKIKHIINSLFPIIPIIPPIPPIPHIFSISSISPIPFKFLFTCVLFSVFFFSCEKDIEVDMPEAEQKIVIEGHIEPGLPPYVILTKTISYFNPTDISTFENLFVHDAVVKVSNGINIVTLTEICSNDTTLPDVFISIISEFVSISPENLTAFNYCIYTTIDQSIFGEVSKTYKLTVIAEGKTYTSTTRIPELVPLDSLWFEPQPTFDSLGFIWTHLTDPDTAGNCYRWFAKRHGKDVNFIPPLGSAIDDKFFNGKGFDFFYDRGSYPGSQDEDELDIETYFYKIGDTIVVKFCTIDKGHYEFWRNFEIAIMSDGNPFAAPTSIVTNIQGGCLGVWGGYGVTYDTLIVE
ncbi:MAG: DUF4249 domain-containing protein [Bacteroidota bacterium]